MRTFYLTIVCCVCICVVSSDFLPKLEIDRKKRDETSANTTPDSGSFGEMFNNFLANLFGSNSTTVSASSQPLNATTASVKAFLKNVTKPTIGNKTPTPTSSSSSHKPVTSSTTTPKLVTTSTTKAPAVKIVSEPPTSAWPSSTTTEDECYEDAVLQNFCPVPEDFTDVSFWDLYSVLFSDTVLDALLIGCTRGAWCLQDRFDYWEALIVERVDMVMKSEIMTSMCTPEVTSCFDKLSESYKNCSMYQEMVYTKEAIGLICRLKENPYLTSECYKHALTALHVTLADVMRKEDSIEEEKEKGICESAEASMTKGLICISNSCPTEEEYFKSFQPWLWFTSGIDNVIDECNLDVNKCESLLQVGTTSTYVKSSSSSYVYSMTSDSKYWSTSEIPSHKSTVSSMTSSMTSSPWTWPSTSTTKMYVDNGADQYGDTLQSNPDQLFASDVRTMVGISIATMVTAIMMTIVVCTCYKRHRRNTVIKEGYQQLLNDADES